MRFSAVTCCLASLVATLVESRLIHDPYEYTAPEGCFGIGAHKGLHDVSAKLVKRDTHSTVTPDSLPCGIVFGGWQSDPFGFPTTKNLRMMWSMAGYAKDAQVIMIMMDVPEGKDEIVVKTSAFDYRYGGFTPLEGRRYYIRMPGRASVRLTWHFAFMYVRPITLCSGALANQKSIDIWNKDKDPPLLV